MICRGLISKGYKLVGNASVALKLKIPNIELAKMVDNYDGWVSLRTGILNQRFV